MISAANFEQGMKEILFSKLTDEEKDRKAKDLIQEVLKEFGYDAGGVVWERILRVTKHD